MRIFLAGDAEGVSSGVGKGVADSSGGNEGVGVGASCAIAAQIEAKAIRIARLGVFVIPSGVEESLTVLSFSSNNKRCFRST